MLPGCRTVGEKCFTLVALTRPEKTSTVRLFCVLRYGATCQEQVVHLDAIARPAKITIESRDSKHPQHGIYSGGGDLMLCPVEFILHDPRFTLVSQPGDRALDMIMNRPGSGHLKDVWSHRAQAFANQWLLCRCRAFGFCCGAHCIPKGGSCLDACKGLRGVREPCGTAAYRSLMIDLLICWRGLSCEECEH